MEDDQGSISMDRLRELKRRLERSGAEEFMLPVFNRESCALYQDGDWSYQEGLSDYLLDGSYIQGVN